MSIQGKYVGWSAVYRNVKKYATKVGILKYDG